MTTEEQHKQILLVETLAIEAASDIVAWAQDKIRTRTMKSWAEMQERCHEIIREKFGKALNLKEPEPEPQGKHPCHP